MQVQKTKPGYKLVKSLYGKKLEIPDEWTSEICSEIFNLKHGHQFGEEDFVKEKGIKILKIEQITMNGSIDLRNCDLIDSKRINEFKNYRIEEGDILLSLTGQLIKPAIVNELTEPVLQNLSLIKLKQFFAVQLMLEEMF